MTNFIYSPDRYGQNYFIFLDNKYTKLYFDIINNAKTKTYDCYTEKHHILPKSLGGDNSQSNLVTLSAREHFICHYLLTKMVNDHFRIKMLSAFMIMKANPNGNNRYVNSYLYEKLKIDFSIMQSFSQQGNNNSQYGTCWVSSFSLKESKKITKNELKYYIDNGWVKKRVLDFSLYDLNGIRIQPVKRYKKPLFTVDLPIDALADQESSTAKIARKILDINCIVTYAHIDQLKEVINNLIFKKGLSPRMIKDIYNIDFIVNLTDYLKSTLKVKIK